MSKENRPAFMFYASDWISGTADMSHEEKGLFIDMLAQQWLRGSLPNDLNKLCRMFGGDASRNAIASILHKFCISESGDLHNAKLERVRESSRAAAEKRSTVNSENAKAGWEKRRANSQEGRFDGKEEKESDYANRNAIALQMESESKDEYVSEVEIENRGVQGGFENARPPKFDGIDMAKEAAHFIEVFGVGQKRFETEAAFLETVTALMSATGGGMGYRARDACTMLQTKAAQYRAFCLAVNQIQLHPPKWLRGREYMTDWLKEKENQKNTKTVYNGKSTRADEARAYTDAARRHADESGL